MKTDPRFWDCECLLEFIHTKAVSECMDCDAIAEDQPDSHASEVMEYVRRACRYEAEAGHENGAVERNAVIEYLCDTMGVTWAEAEGLIREEENASLTELPRVEVAQEKYLALKKSHSRLLRHSNAVMRTLETYGPPIVPHLMDTDENDGQRLREAIAAGRKLEAMP